MSTGTPRDNHLSRELALGLEDLVGGVELSRSDGVVIVGVNELEPGLNLSILQLPAWLKRIIQYYNQVFDQSWRCLSLVNDEKDYSRSSRGVGDEGKGSEESCVHVHDGCWVVFWAY